MRREAKAQRQSSLSMVEVPLNIESPELKQKTMSTYNAKVIFTFWDQLRILYVEMTCKWGMIGLKFSSQNGINI